MEQHGNNHQQNVIAIIPARYDSVRLPGKMLLPIGGKALILHTCERARAASLVDRVTVATDDQRIFDAVAAGGFEVVMTSAEHRSGSDRIAEVAEGLADGTIVVNVQGDEPTIDPETIDRAVKEMISDTSADIVTVYEMIETATDLADPNIVKVVSDSSGRALYFSRSPIPFVRDRVGDFDLQAGHYKKHTGLYVYRREFLLRFSKMGPGRLELAEKLEQLRALENGAIIKVVEAAGRSVGVDTPDDLEKMRAVLEAQLTYN
ncbi:MAG: 3-deoxy-manno-octulosonate cytidylyltransferase [Blastocatellia bacterium]|nr:3-deoxy-manno-octulosonate cytidylyltransferase [Blastocatellia bacterium]